MDDVAIGPGQYRCEACGGVFGKTRSDEQALAAVAVEFPGVDVDTEPMGLACDDCYEAMKASGLFDIPIDRLR